MTKPLRGWIDAHSVNCYKCGRLFDEREGYVGKGGEGEICESCVKKYPRLIDND
jgi:hypothetical protein